MKHKFVRLQRLLLHVRQFLPEEILAILLAVFLIVSPASASTRFDLRSLYINNATPGAVTSYKLTFQYMSPQAVGSVNMLFCNDPIPYDPCVTPTNLDVSHAVLSDQTGETGFMISSLSTNHIVLTRSSAGLTAPGVSSYTFTGIKNPTDTSQAFSIRLASFGSEDASGPQIDFGSVRSAVNTPITIETQVPPMLIFCAAQEVQEDCSGTNDVYNTDMGTLSPTSTLVAQSQIAVGTNASQGFAITANGLPLSAGVNTIAGSATPTISEPGTNQFGINLVANNEPAIGGNPEGAFTNANPTTDYDQPNKYKYVSGDVIASSPNVSLVRKFTVSYILNASPNLKAGQYSTTINFIASGRF
jgi:hypothetical protein